MFTSISVVGAGRVGQAAALRLGERVPTRLTGRGRELAVGEPDLVLLCVPDRAIPQVAASLETGPWVCHTSGAVSVSALDPHARRFALHPLQTFQPGLGPEQFDGSYAALTAESEEAEAAGLALAELLGLRPFPLADEARPVYHAAATLVASYLVTLRQAARDLMEAAEAPPDALDPLLRRTVENGFAPTGPHVRGDHATVELHLRGIAARRPQLAPLYRELARASEALALR